MKSIGTNPRNDGARGDERIRTAELFVANDSPYDRIADEVGFYLAGLTDGEGCFVIAPIANGDGCPENSGTDS